MRKCEDCVHNKRDRCSLEVFEPCQYVPRDPDKRARDIYLAAVTIIVGILITIILLWACKPRAVEPEEQKPDAVSAVQLLRELHGKELSEFDKLTLAIAFTESRWNPDARGKAGDSGCLQLLPIYVAEVNRLFGTEYTIDDAFDIDKSLAMFQALQSHYNPTKDIHLGIYFHNKSAAYERVVLENLEMIERYEALRAKLIMTHY